jgi:subtilisin family serine protease
MARSRNTWTRFVARVAAAAGLIAATAIAVPTMATARPAPPDPDGGPSRAPTPEESGEIDLADFAAQRWIVQLDGAPVAVADTAAGQLDVTTPANVAYRRALKADQTSFRQRLARVAPGARVERTYQVVVNGLAVDMSAQQAAEVRQMPGVRAVTPDIPFQLDMFATPQQIGAPAVWEQLGGQSKAGRGVKVAIIDSGIYVTRDASGAFAGNPCFDDTGYKAPKGFPKGDTRFTNNKVIVARAYFRPDDPPTAGNDTPIQGPGGSPHGTHTAGTVACDAGTHATIQSVDVELSGVAPAAYLMNYRVFYPSQSNSDFQNGNAYVAELVQAIDQAVIDGADVISNSWGSSYQNTLAWPDPMVQAAESAVDAGVTMVFAQGNSGPDEATGNSPANSPKVIAVGATTKNVTIVPGTVDVTAPTPVPPALTAMPVGPAQFGAQLTANLGPAPYVPAQVVGGGSSLGCAAFPAGSLNGAIALIERGVCEFSTKVLNAQNAGAVAALVYNSAANGDNIQAMGPGAVANQVTIPSWFMRRSQGLAMRDFYTANPGAAMAQFNYSPQVAPNIGDVMAGFSSRGPTQDKTLKPDVVAPGVDVVSAGYAVGPFPTPFTGFGPQSGTSMATPHVAGAAALLLDLHPNWTPAQVKSALMTTATERVFLNTTHTAAAGVLDRGSGRIDLAAAANPGLTLDQPSLSGGEVAAGTQLTFTIQATGTNSGADQWAVTTAGSGITITPSTTALSVSGQQTVSLGVTVATAADAEPGDYDGEVVLTNAATGQRLHVPVWLGVRPAPTTDVLLVDDDGSALPDNIAVFADYAATYRAALDTAGVSYDYLDIDEESFPAAIDLYQYRSIVVFTGDNNSFNTSGFFLSDQDAIAQWMDSGGRLWMSGQNIAETSDSNTLGSPTMGRSRLYHGYLGLRYVTGSTFPAAAPAPTADGEGIMSGVELDLSPNGDGIDNQTSIESADAFPDNDTFQAAGTMTPLFDPVGDVEPAGSAIAFSRGSEPSLEEERVMYRYRSVSMGFGLEGVNGTDQQEEVTGRTLGWLLDRLEVGTAVSFEGKNRRDATLTATAESSSGADIVQYRWDFGDKSPIVTDGPTVTHHYHARKMYDARVEVTDSLGHVTVAHIAITV